MIVKQQLIKVEFSDENLFVLKMLDVKPKRAYSYADLGKLWMKIHNNDMMFICLPYDEFCELSKKFEQISNQKADKFFDYCIELENDIIKLRFQSNLFDIEA